MVRRILDKIDLFLIGFGAVRFVNRGTGIDRFDRAEHLIKSLESMRRMDAWE